ncbi:MAG TPA: TetR/AcrR family transcriptional regulator [Candidatus Stackebrandtia faecavium]|nr:TetR/AcrR family transcriptional regulator [Candidatus Stackebrandtia faecavium]
MAQTSAQRGVAVRSRLLQAAAELIGERGWHAVSTRMLAERAGVRPGLVHYHFASLSALLNAAAIASITDLLDESLQQLQGAPDLEAGLRGIAELLQPYSGDDPFSLLYLEAYLAAARDPELKTELSRIVEDFRAALTDWLRANRQSEPDATARVLMATIDGLLLQRPMTSSTDPQAMETVLRRLLEQESTA